MDPAVLTLNGVLANHARFGACRPAFALGEDVRSRREMDARYERVAQALERYGLGRGSAIALLTPNSFEAIELIFGAARAGVVVVPLSPMLQPDALGRLAADAGAELLFAGAPHQQLGASIEGFSPARRIAIDFPAGGDYGVAYGDFLGPAAPSRRRSYDPAAPYCIIYSSGTTGLPKGIVHTDATRLEMGRLLAMAFLMDSTAVTLLATPPFTNGTWMMMIPTMTAGGECVLLRAFALADFAAAVQRHRVTHVFMVPTQIRALLDWSDSANYDFSSLRRVVSAGAALPQAVRRRFIERFGNVLMELYGLTEGVGTTITPEDALRKPGSVGVPAMGTEIELIDEAGTIVATGEVGEIAGRTSAVMLGYHKRPEANEAATWIHPDGRAFLRTGDMGRLDEDGYLYIVDRKKDMIKSGGLNVYPSDIEAVLRGHPAIRDAAVVGIAHEKWDEVPAAVVTLLEGASATPEEVQAWANERLGKPQRLQRLEISAGDLPRNALGKVLKGDLRARFEPNAG